MEARHHISMEWSELKRPIHVVSGIVIIHESDFDLVKGYGWRKCEPPGFTSVDGYITVSREQAPEGAKLAADLPASANSAA